MAFFDLYGEPRPQCNRHRQVIAKVADGWTDGRAEIVLMDVVCMASVDAPLFPTERRP